MPELAATSTKEKTPDISAKPDQPILYTTESQEEILLLMMLEYPPVKTGCNEGRLCYTFERTSEVQAVLQKLELQGAKSFHNLNYGNMLDALNNWKRALARMKAGNIAFA